MNIFTANDFNMPFRKALKGMNALLAADTQLDGVFGSLREALPEIELTKVIKLLEDASVEILNLQSSFLAKIASKEWLDSDANSRSMSPSKNATQSNSGSSEPLT